MRKTHIIRQSWWLRTAFMLLMTGMLGIAAQAQCLNAPNGQWPSGTFTPNCNGVFADITTAGWAGEYSMVNVVSGTAYTFRSSVASDFITISNSAGTTAFTSGVSGTGGITWTSTVTGTVRFYTHLSAACGSAQISRTRSVRCGASFDPCNSQPNVTCGTAITGNTGNGSGAWNNYGGPFGVPGQEVLWKYTPTVSGLHTINVTSITGGGFVDFFWKAASVGCNATGWTYIDDFSTTGPSVTFNLTAGTTYYILMDDENTTANSVTFNISCPIPAYDPCTSISNISACNVSVSSANNAGTGAWNNYGGPFGVPGQEKVFTYTPTTSGLYTINVNAISGGYYVDFFFKAASVGCNATGWTYIDDFNATGTSAQFSLTAGTTYYIMWDDEDVNASAVTFQLNCPVPDPCTTIIGTACGSSNSTTLAAGPSVYNPGGCFATPGQELIYSFTSTFAGTYFINVSANTGTDYFDYYFRTASSGCNGTGWTCIDDISAPGSSVGFTLAANTTYYILVDKENWLGNTATQTQTWSVVCPTPPANDDCSGATVFTGNSQPFSTVSSTGSDVSSCTLNDVNDIWYTWTAPYCASVTFSTCGSANYDTQLSLYTSCASGEIACNDDACASLQSSITATVVGGQTYWLRVSGYNGATGTGTVNLTISSELTGGISSSTNVSCFGGSDGSATVSASGGTTPYSYAWSNGATTATASGLSAGTYTVTVTDASGCSFTSSVTITEPTALAGSLIAQTYVGGHNISCNGAADGSIFANVSGGTPAYSYAWSNGATTQMVSGLTAGTYSVTVTDANGCTLSMSITLTEPAPMANTISSPTYACGTNVSCNGATDGSIDLTVTGGSGNYAFNWSNGATTEDLSGLGAGTYSVTATDQNGCTTTGSITLTEPALLSTSLTTSSYACGYGVSCNGASNGSVTSATTGGCPPYSYQWSNSGAGGSINGVPAGTYSVTVTDANGCQAFATAEITQPAPLTISCSGNTTVYYGWPASACATISASGISGGCAPYSITWSNGATGSSQTVCPTTTTDYTATVTDANGCTASCVVRVCVIDVRCGNNLQKIEICHNGNTMCISPNAFTVQAHINHGDYLGACGSNVPCGTSSKMDADEPAAAHDHAEMVEMEAFPNPFQSSTTLRFTVPADDQAKLTVFAMDGRDMGILFEGQVLSHKTYEVDFNANNAPNGIYFAKLTLSNGEVTTMKLVLMK